MLIPFLPVVGESLFSISTEGSPYRLTKRTNVKSFIKYLKLKLLLNCLKEKREKEGAHSMRNNYVLGRHLTNKVRT